MKIRHVKSTFEKLVESNKKEILNDKKAMNDIDRKLEEKLFERVNTPMLKGNY